MEQKKFCLSWQPYRKNISHSLCSLQQNGEFVDMTLAADGHFVKVHRVIMAFASPYIKDLISSIECPHPVVFLNKISYKTLCLLLEYIYTGEVVVAADNFNELIQACKELHIKGLDNLDPNVVSKCESTATYDAAESLKQLAKVATSVKIDLKETPEPAFVSCSSESKSTANDHSVIDVDNRSLDGSDNDMNQDDSPVQEDLLIERASYTPTTTESNEKLTQMDRLLRRIRPASMTKDKDSSLVQYTLSNHGKLQLILNRYIYYIRYVGVKRRRTWRCINCMSVKNKCNAYVITQDDSVVRRIGEHNHSFHDSKILKKIECGAIYTAIQDAEKGWQGQKTK